jgi:hypothetical protein
MYVCKKQLPQCNKHIMCVCGVCGEAIIYVIFICDVCDECFSFN